MVNKDRFRFFLALLFAQVFFLGINPTKTLAQTDLVVEGNVLGYNLYKVRPVSNTTFPILLKVTKVIEGVEKSEYIVINLGNLYEEYAEENFGINKTITFKIRRKTFCDTKIKNLFRLGSTTKEGKIVKTPSTFTLVPDVKKNSLPLKKKVPCYFESELFQE